MYRLWIQSNSTTHTPTGVAIGTHGMKGRILYRRGTRLLAAGMLGLASNAIEAQRPPAGSADGESMSPWAYSIRGGAVQQFESDLDEGGAYSADRFYIQAGANRLMGPRRFAGLSIGYGYDNYTFAGDSGFSGLDPWSNVNTLRLSAPIRWPVREKWALFALPTLRATAQSGANLGEGLSGGILGGASYKISETLSIGPGLGLLTDIEEGISAFPILLVDWKITSSLALRTGRGLAATRGPGLELGWDPSQAWSLAVGARYDSFRFRLDDDGPSPGGVGEEKGFPVYLSASYNAIPRLRLSALGGMTFGGSLRLEDERGDLIAQSDYDPAPFLGLVFDIKL